VKYPRKVGRDYGHVARRDLGVCDGKIMRWAPQERAHRFVLGFLEEPIQDTSDICGVEVDFQGFQFKVACGECKERERGDVSTVGQERRQPPLSESRRQTRASVSRIETK